MKATPKEMWRIYLLGLKLDIFQRKERAGEIIPRDLKHMLLPSSSAHGGLKVKDRGAENDPGNTPLINVYT